MSRTFKTFIGFFAIAMGLLLFMGTMSRGRLGRSAHSAHHHAAYEARLEQRLDSAENTTSTDFQEAHADAAATHRGQRGHRHGGFGLIGMLLRIAALGLILKFILGKVRRKHQGHGPIHAEASSDDLVDDIRVGDEINRDSPPVDTDDLTVDDLLHAMKRLGIKKLEL